MWTLGMFLWGLPFKLSGTDNLEVPRPRTQPLRYNTGFETESMKVAHYHTPWRTPSTAIPKRRYTRRGPLAASQGVDKPRGETSIASS